MSVANPQSLLSCIDPNRYAALLEPVRKSSPKNGPVYVEPGQATTASEHSSVKTLIDPSRFKSSTVTPAKDKIHGKIQRLGDFVDTDAVSVNTL